MEFTQKELSILVLVGSSLFFHLCSAGNFLPASEMSFIARAQLYLNQNASQFTSGVLKNKRQREICFIYVTTSLFIARISLSSVVAVILLEASKPGLINRYIGVGRSEIFKYLFKLTSAAFLTTLVRFLLPGPVTYFSLFYKLSLLLSCAASVFAFIPQQTLSHSSHSVRHKLDDGSSDMDSNRKFQRSPTIEEAIIPTKRHRTAMELLQTETSYLRNLKTIITVYKEPLEMLVAEGKPLLAPEDIRQIFGGIKEIIDVHTNLQHDISEIIDNWEEDCCIADVVKKYKNQLKEVYPNYVNFFDMGQTTLIKKQETDSEFNEFLVKCFKHPQSLQQNLEALLIRPVQRLPSLALLIKDLQKRTPAELRDHDRLKEAEDALKFVLSHINEDKRKTESKTKVFDIVYEVSDCPVEIIASTRFFVQKVDVSTLNDGFYREGERLALYLLNDVLEIAKWRNRSRNKCLLKHAQLMPLHNIISIMNLDDKEDECIFAVRYRSSGNNSNEYSDEKVSVLRLLDDKNFKKGWLQAFATQVANVKNLPNINEILIKVGPADILNFLKRNTKLYKRLRSKRKDD